jgi:hypothetical protein
MQKRRFHSQNAGFEMSAPVDNGVKILAGTDVSPSHRIHACETCTLVRPAHL